MQISQFANTPPWQPSASYYVRTAHDQTKFKAAKTQLNATPLLLA